MGQLIENLELIYKISDKLIGWRVLGLRSADKRSFLEAKI